MGVKQAASQLGLPYDTLADWRQGLSIAIMKKGYAVEIEKPPGMNRAQTLAMMRAAKQYGAPHQVAFNRRFTPLLVELRKRLTENRRPGDIQTIRYDLYRVGRRDRDFSATAIHGIDAARFLAGEPYQHVSFDYQELPQLGEGVANIFMEGSFQSGARAQLSFCPDTGITLERAVACLHDYTYFVNLPIWNFADAPGSLVGYQKDKKTLEIPGGALCTGGEMFETNGFYAEDAGFFEDIRHGRKPLNNLANSLQSVEIADCIRRRLPVYDAGEAKS